MARRITASDEFGKLRDNQRRLVAALQMTFDLLEDYAPLWYTRKHRDLLTTTLASVGASERRPPAKLDESFPNQRKRYAHYRKSA